MLTPNEKAWALAYARKVAADAASQHPGDPAAQARVATRRGFGAPSVYMTDTGLAAPDELAITVHALLALPDDALNGFEPTL